MRLHGYVGYDEGKSLVEKIRKKPYCVVLFDEIEKANDDVLNILLQILEDGKLTDSNGNVANFQETLVILTSNIGAEIMNKKNGIGFKFDTGDFKKEEIFNELKKNFKPELLNRLDEIVIFNHLKEIDIRKIFKNKFNELKDVMKEKKIFIDVSEKAEKQVIQNSNFFQYGARTIRREIEQSIEDVIVDGIISNNIRSGDSVFIDYDMEKDNFFIIKNNSK